MRHIACSILAASFILLQSLDPASAENPRVPPGARQADRHNPFSKNYVDFQPNGLARRSASNSNSGQSQNRSRVVVLPNYYYRPYFVRNYCPPYYGSGYYGSGYYGSGNGYPQGSNTFNTTNINININAADLGAVGNPLFADNNQALGAANRGAVGQANGRSLELGRRFISFGDKQFSQGNYLDAQLRYRKAIKAAPDFAEAYFRRGQAMLALGQYDLAAEAFKEGLILKPMWALEGFRLGDLYGENQPAINEHLEALLKEVDQQPLNPDLEFLVAWQLYFGGQRDASHQHFVRAAALSPDPGHLDNFMATFDHARPVAFPKVKMDGPDVEVDGPQVEVDGPRVEVDGPEVEIDGPDVEIPVRRPTGPFRPGVEF